MTILAQAYVKSTCFYEKQGRHATNDASIMCSNGGVGHGVGCGGFDGSSDGVDDNVVKGRRAVVKQYSIP